MIKSYPCEVKVGEYLITRDGRKRKISELNGKYIVTDEGSQFSYKHPDIVSIEEETVEIEITDEKKEEKAEKKSSKKSKKSVKKEEEAE